MLWKLEQNPYRNEKYIEASQKHPEEEEKKNDKN